VMVSGEFIRASDVDGDSPMVFGEVPV